MYNHNGTWDFLKIAAMLIFIGLAVWWIESRFGATAVLIVLGAIIGTACFIGGAILTHTTAKVTMDNLTKFNANDAQTDRFRMQSFKALAGGEAALRRAQAQLTVLDARRVNQLANQQAKLLTDTQRAQWEVEHGRQQTTADVWSWDDDNNNNGDAFAGWE